MHCRIQSGGWPFQNIGGKHCLFVQLYDFSPIFLTDVWTIDFVYRSQTENLKMIIGWLKTNYTINFVWTHDCVRGLYSAIGSSSLSSSCLWVGTSVNEERGERERMREREVLTIIWQFGKCRVVLATPLGWTEIYYGYKQTCIRNHAAGGYLKLLSTSCCMEPWYTFSTAVLF